MIIYVRVRRSMSHSDQYGECCMDLFTVDSRSQYLTARSHTLIVHLSELESGDIVVVVKGAAI